MGGKDDPVILVVDDDESHLQVVEKVFVREGFKVLRAAEAVRALDLLRSEPVDLLVTDLQLPGMNGIELIKAAQVVQPTTEAIVMTAFGTVERAVEAMKEGAYDFIEKPIKRALLLKSARRALERRALLAENDELREALSHMRAERVLIGRSEEIRRLVEMVRQIAPTHATVLITGASGTGKDLVAQMLHQLSSRGGRAFVAVNCAALPTSLMESELFGHERGAFTGAHQRKLGRFEAADGGTLFLDEIGELPLDTQAKLLRVLEGGTFERVGGSKSVQVDVRIVAATNKILAEEVRLGRFREDLYYRLNVISIEVPTLAARRDDVPLLAEHFLRLFTAAHGRRVSGFSREAMAALCAYSWPGNVRELCNAVERAVVLCGQSVIDVGDLPAALGAGGGEVAPRVLSVPVGTPLESVKRMLILETLRMTRGDKRLASQLLGITTRTIYRLLEELGDEDR